jgi:hypothetical protein
MKSRKMADCAIKGDDGRALPPNARKSWASEGTISCGDTKGLDCGEKNGSSDGIGSEEGKTTNCSIKKTTKHAPITNHHMLLLQMPVGMPVQRQEK